MNFYDIGRSGLCLGCGVCTALSPLNIKAKEKNGILLPNFKELDNSGITPSCCCPAIEPEINKHVFDKFQTKLDASNIDIGIYKNIFLTSSLDDNILEKSCSGGLITEIALYLLENKIVDGVITQTIEYSESGPRTKDFIARTREDVMKAQCSKYCPTNIEESLKGIMDDKKGSYCLIGLPCQINAVKKAETAGLIRKDLIKYTIGNFCGGFKDYRELDDLIIRNGKNPAKVKYFQFRGGGQPGFLKISDNTGEDVKIKYPKYGAGSYINKFDRCTLCIDATALLADFSCGDAWLDERSKKIDQATLVIARTEEAENMLNKLIDLKRIISYRASENDVRISQKHNLDSKIFRQNKRRIVYRLFGKRVPIYDVDIPESKTSILYELKVYIGKIKLNIFYILKVKLGLKRK